MVSWQTKTAWIKNYFLSLTLIHTENYVSIWGKNLFQENKQEKVHQKTSSGKVWDKKQGYYNQNEESVQHSYS